MNKNEINMLRPRRLHGWRETNEEYQQIAPRQKRSFLFYLIPGLIIIMIFTSFSFIRNRRMVGWSQNPNDYSNITLQPKKKGFLSSLKSFLFKSNNVIEGQKNDRINILLLGIGGANHDGGYLSDTNIIISIKPSTNEVAMISVPRDMSAKIKGYGWTKINHAHAYGEMNKAGQGGEFARKTFEENLKIDIPYYYTVDFKAFKDIIDAVGGVTINVPRSFIDYSYPGENYSYQTVKFKKGIEKMGGERALIFARSRHGNNGEGSDFARAKRQQMVIAALKEKLLSAGTYLNPVKIKKIFDSIENNTNTNLEFGQIMYLAGVGRDVNVDNIKTLVLDNASSGYLRSIIGYDGAYLLAPKTGSFGQITNAIKNIFDPNATSTIPIYSITNAEQTDLPFPSAKIEIQNGTWRSGLASRSKRDLEDTGFAVYTIGNTTIRPIVTSSLVILNTEIEQGFIEALERVIEIDSTTTLPDWIASNTTTLDTTAIDESSNKYYDANSDILIILGETNTTSTITTTVTEIENNN